MAHRFDDLMIDIGPAPCDTCSLSKACNSQLLACSDFFFWHSSGESRHQEHERLPMRWLWMLLFRPIWPEEEAVEAGMEEVMAQRTLEMQCLEGKEPWRIEIDGETRTLSEWARLARVPPRKLMKMTGYGTLQQVARLAWRLVNRKADNDEIEIDSRSAS